MSSERNIILYVLLTFLTCGLWGLVWFFQLGGDIQRLRGDGKPNLLVDFLLSLLTCGLWSLYVAYQWPVFLQEPLRARGQHVDDNLPVICLMLSFFGLHLLGFVLMQSAVNQSYRHMDSPA